MLFCVFACSTLLCQTTQILKNVLAGLNFLKNVVHPSIPQPIWTPLNLGNSAMIAASVLSVWRSLSVWPRHWGQLRASVS